MPEIYDPQRRIKIGLTDNDYEDYQNGDLSGDFYARRTDGSIANRVDISALDDEDKQPSGGIDTGSAAIGALIMAAFVGVAYGVKKLWNGYKAKRAEADATEQRKTQVVFQRADETPAAIEVTNTELSTETIQVDGTEQGTITQEEAIQELMKIIAGMAEIADGKKKILEGVENLSHAGIVDRATLLEKLSDPKVLEGFNAYLESNPQLVIQNHTILGSIFGRNLTMNGQYIPLAASDIEQQLKTEIIQEDK